MQIKSNVLFILALCLLVHTIFAEERDPFLSPFEEKLPQPKIIKEKNSESKKSSEPTQNKELLDAIQLIEKGDYTKALTLLESFDLQKQSDSDKEKITELKNIINEKDQYETLIRQYQALMNINGKIILDGKPNILLVNEQTITENESLKELLKIDHDLILNHITENSYQLKINHINLKFPLD